MPRRLVRVEDMPKRRGIHVFLGNTPRCSVPSHWHDGVELTLILAGKAEQKAGGQCWQLGRGDAILAGGSTPHAIRHKGSCRLALWLLDPDTVRALAVALPVHDHERIPPAEHFRPASPLAPYRLNDADRRCVQALSQRAVDLLRQPEGSARDQVLRSLAGAALALVINSPQIKGFAYPAAELPALLRAIRRHPARDWSRDHLCLRTGLNRTRLAAAFRAATGMTATAYIRQARLDRAEQLLHEEPELSVGEIATLVGFQNSAYFIRCFSKAFGCPPQSWRRQQNT